MASNTGIVLLFAEYDSFCDGSFGLVIFLEKELKLSVKSTGFLNEVAHTY